MYFIEYFVMKYEINDKLLTPLCFDQITSPACTELEVQVMNWFGKILDLPKEFLNESEGPGGGVLQVHIKQYM